MSEQEQQKTTQKKSRGGVPAWVWLFVIIIGFVVVPFVGCGALGLGLAVASPAPSGSSAGLPAPRNSVGVITVEGVIFEGDVPTGATPDSLSTLLRQADEDENIAAIVLRINSPGGGVSASDQIHHYVAQVEKPIVVSMGTTAASGGYYIAAPAEYIYATPSTITGSIGVISQFISAEEFLEEYGIEVITVVSGDFKDFGQFSNTPTEEELAYFREITIDLYEDFVQVVVDGRDLSREEVLELADGRIFTGEQAVELGLVDEVGYLDDALDKAAELGGLGDDYNVYELSAQLTFFDSLAGFQVPQQEIIVVPDPGLPMFEYRYVGP